MIVGDGGTVAPPAGVGVAEALSEALLPYAFDATRKHVYRMPFVRPLTTIGLAIPVTPTNPQLAVYTVIGEPPFELAAKLMVTCPFPAVAEIRFGTAGWVA
jgi:hypothetical protein